MARLRNSTFENTMPMLKKRKRRRYKLGFCKWKNKYDICLGYADTRWFGA